MSKPVALDPEVTVVHPEGHLAQTWQVRLPPGISYPAIFQPETWAAVEMLMRKRGNGKRPMKSDLIRIISAGGSFDVVCLVASVANGYVLEYYSGKRPSSVQQVVLDDLATLPDHASSADLKARARNFGKRWAAAGVTKEDIGRVRRAQAKSSHPDTHAGDGRKLAQVNAVLDDAMRHLGEAA
jgi:hypothetical protein